MRQMLHVEQKRTERSGRHLVLMLLGFGRSPAGAGQLRTIEKLLVGLSNATRETDVKGWYKNRSVLGIIFTEIVADEAKSVANVLLNKIASLLRRHCRGRKVKIEISVQIFPHDWDEKHSETFWSTLPVEFRGNLKREKHLLAAKRSVDIVGSSICHRATSPLFSWLLLSR